MTLPRLAALNERWGKTPPLCVTVAAIGQALGLKPKQAVPTGSNAEGLMNELGGVSGFGGSRPQWLSDAEAAEKANV